MPPQHDPNSPLSLTEKSWFHVAAVILFWPYGLYLLARTKRYPKALRYGPIAFVGAVIALMVGTTVINSAIKSYRLSKHVYRFTVTLTQDVRAVRSLSAFEKIRDSANASAQKSVGQNTGIKDMVKDARTSAGEFKSFTAQYIGEALRSMESQFTVQYFNEASFSLPAGKAIDVVHLYGLSKSGDLVSVETEDYARWALVADPDSKKALGIVYYSDLSRLEKIGAATVAVGASTTNTDNLAMPENMRRPGESAFDYGLRTGNMDEYKAEQAKETIRLEEINRQAEGVLRAEQAREELRLADLKRQADKDRLKQREEARMAAEKEAKDLRIAAAASRLFVTNWKEVKGAISATSTLNIVVNILPAQVDSKSQYNLDQDRVFEGAFYRAEDSRNVRILTLHDLSLSEIKRFADLISKFKSWSRKAAENKMVGLNEQIGYFENQALSMSLSIDGVGNSSLVWEKGMVRYAQSAEEASAAEVVFKTALEQADSLKADCEARANDGEDVKSTADLFK